MLPLSLVGAGFGAMRRGGEFGCHGDGSGAGGDFLDGGAAGYVGCSWRLFNTDAVAPMDTDFFTRGEANALKFYAFNFA
jgi:hypothetical protein